MQQIYNQGVANYLNNKFGEDYTKTELNYAITTDGPQRLVIIKDWNKADEWMKRAREEAQREEQNLVGFVI